MIILWLAVGGTDGALIRGALRRGGGVLCLLIYALFICKANAADPQPYQVTIEPSVSSAIDELLNSTSLLVTLREQAPVPPFGLITRARGDVERLSSVLNSFGYYRPMVAITIEGRSLDDPDLPPFLDQVAQGMPVNVQVAIEEGPLYHLRRVELEGMVP